MNSKYDIVVSRVNATLEVRPPVAARSRRADRIIITGRTSISQCNDVYYRVNRTLAVMYDTIHTCTWDWQTINNL